MRRLTYSGIKPFAMARLKDQGGLCPLCMDELTSDEAVLDHCHKTGECRGVLHRGCNALMGKLENNKAMNKMMCPERFARFMAAVPGYIEAARLGVLYPTHKTEAEKKIKRNKKARVARAKLKESASE